MEPDICEVAANVKRSQISNFFQVYILATAFVTAKRPQIYIFFQVHILATIFATARQSQICNFVKFIF